MTVIIHCAASSLSVYYRAQFWAPLKPLIFSKPALFLIGRMIPWASRAKLFSAAELVFRAQTALSCQEAMYVIEKFHRSLCHWVTSPPPSEKPNEFRHITQILPTLLPLHIHQQPVLRSPSAAPQQKHIPALCSPAIKAAENVQGRPWRHPRLVGCSTPQCQSSRTPGSRLISSAFYCRGRAEKRAYTRLSDWSVMLHTLWEPSLWNTRYTHI